MNYKYKHVSELIVSMTSEGSRLDTLPVINKKMMISIEYILCNNDNELICETSQNEASSNMLIPDAPKIQCIILCIFKRKKKNK